MKTIYKIILIMIAIPFIIVFFFAKDVISNKNEDLVIDSPIQVLVKRVGLNRIDAINLEMYVLGVVAGEMPFSFELEALKAQAVASRTYVLKRIMDNANKAYYVTDTAQYQVYQDQSELEKKWKQEYHNRIIRVGLAVFETRGEYLEYNGKIIDALFFSTSNGYTENSEDFFYNSIPYLRSVESNWDQTLSPVFNSNKIFTLNEFCINLGITCSNTIQITDITRSSSNRIIKININNKLFTGRKVQDILKLKSNDFTIEQHDQTIIVKTKGYGHGVGMSQYGAHGMALAKYSYKEILDHYYQNIKIKNIYDTSYK